MPTVLKYGSETWTLASDTNKHLESCEMLFLRRMMKIPWTDKVSDEEVLRRAGVQRKFKRKGGLENLALTGKIVGREE